MSDKMKVLLVLGVAIVLAAAGEALAAKGMKATAQTAADAGVWAQIKAAAGNGHVWLGTALMGSYVLLYVYALGLAELSFAVPLSAASYLLGVMLGKFYLHEEVKPARWIGTAVIIAGVVIVAVWGQNSGDGDKNKDSGGGKGAPPPAQNKSGDG